MTYGELYKEAEGMLGSAFEAAQLFAHTTNKRVNHLPSLGGRPVPQGEEKLMLDLCRRRLQGEPLQYLLGEWEFYSLPFRVGKGVLIPRQDTETLVDAALEKIRGMDRPQVLDLCSGTGCVAVAIAHHCPGAQVTALELSDQAFDYLGQNIALNKSPVVPVHADLRDYRHPVPLDALVANPPYIPRHIIATLQEEVRHEPPRALDGGVDGLDFYRAILRRYRPQIKRGGWALLEVGVGQSRQVRQIMEAEGFGETGVREDYNGVARVVLGRAMDNE